MGTLNLNYDKQFEEVTGREKSKIKESALHEA